MNEIVVLMALATTWSAVTTGAVAAVTLQRSPSEGRTPPVSVLKPLCGADPALEENLRSFFEQDHPSFQLVFGVQRPDDPALPIVERLRAEHPAVDVAVVVHSFSEGLNPKVRNLRGMLPHAKYEHLLISDSNVRAPRDYLREATELHASAPDVGLVTHLFAGTGGSTLASAVEEVQLAGFVAGGAATPSLFGHASVVGKSMLMCKAHLTSVGGLEGVADILAEDYVLGQRLQARGLRTVIGRTVLLNVVGDLDGRALVERHARWAMMRRRLSPLAFWLEPLASPLVLLPWAFLALGHLALVWAAVTYLGRDVLAESLLKRRPCFRNLLLGPLRDAAMLVAWFTALSKSHVHWRGTRVYVGRGTSLSLG
jgi:ceramide glucosyltransferase